MLTSAGDGEAHTGRVPRADASNLAQTTVGLPGKTGHAPTRDNALGTVSLGGAEHIDALVLKHAIKTHPERKGRESNPRKSVEG